MPIFSFQPLEGLLGSPGATAGQVLPPSQTGASMQMPAAHATPYSANKQSVPCFYFQKGLCLKGDRCPYMHGSEPIVNPPLQQAPKVAGSVTEPTLTLKKPTMVFEKCTSQQKIPQANIVKPLEAPPTANPAPNNGIPAKRTMPSVPLINELSRPKQNSAPVVSVNAANRPRAHQAPPLEEHLQNGREAGEFLGESSPGFDVLVDDEPEEAEYFHHEDEYGRAAGNGSRHINLMNEYDYDHPSEHESLAKFDREPYNGYRDYDQYGRPHDQFGWEQPRVSSERVIERQSVVERRRLREESPDQIDRSDLRHRLSKQRKVNGSRSTTSPDRRVEINRRDDRYGEERRYRGHPRRDQRLFPPETSISNRLQGRITLPGRSSPDKANDLHSDRDMDRVRNWGRSSPGRSLPYQGRHHDKIRRSQENFASEGRNFRGQSIKRDETDTVNFAGPKSLAELKGTKVSDSSEELSTKTSNAATFRSQVVVESKTMKMGKHNEEPENSLSFEGPKSLGEILKRKRGAVAGNGTSSSEGEDSSHKERSDSGDGSPTAATEIPTAQAFDSNKEARVTTDTVQATEENDNYDDGLATAEGDELVHDDPSAVEKGEALAMEAGMRIDTTEDHELDTYEQGEGEYDFDLTEGGEFKNEDDNADAEEEYMDDEDGDDFSSRIGAMLS